MGQPEESSLTDNQEKTLAIIPLITGALSAWGSFQIIYMVLKSSQRNVYKRIMLGISCSDLMSSTVLALQAFLLPRETSFRTWAGGTQATCTAMGFLQQLATATIWYCGMLSFMFLLQINYQIPDARMAQRYEPWMHAVSIGYPLVTAILGLALGLYGELVISAQCWISGGSVADYVLGYVAAAIPAFFFFLAIPINNLRIYLHLSHLQQSDSTATEQEKTGNNLGRVCPGTSASCPQTSNTSASTSTSFNREEEREQELARQKQKLAQDRQRDRLSAVAFQAFLYVAAYVITYLPSIIIRVTAGITRYTSKDEDKLFPLLVLQAIFFPLQGLFNYCIYTRPSYLRESING